MSHSFRKKNPRPIGVRTTFTIFNVCLYEETGSMVLGGSRPLRPLFPAVDPSQRQSSSSDRRPTKRARQLACVSCRDRKTKCDGEKPSCGECSRKSMLCRYPESDSALSKREMQSQVEELQRRVATFEQFVGMLRTISKGTAATVLERVRAGTEVDHLLNNVSGADLLLQLSVVPETRRRYDFPYSKHMPKHLLFEGNAYLQSSVYEASFSQVPWVPKKYEKLVKGPYRGYPISFPSDAYDKPFHAATLADPMLEKIDVSKWTTVTSDNQLLRKFLGTYFQFPSVLSPVFHKDLLLDDMITGRGRFASKLLVNAVLAAGCQACLDMDRRWMLCTSDNLAYKFLCECKRLWELEPLERNRLTTVQAALVMNMIYNLDGKDFIAIRYLDLACHMAKALDLFGLLPSSTSVKSYRARTTTAWALYSRQAAVCITYSRPLNIEKPPAVPLPDPKKHPEFYALVLVQYPLSEQLISLHMDHKIYLEAQLYAILGELANSTPVEKQTLGDAFRFKSKMDHWFAKVTEIFDPNALVFPVHLDLHMQYYYWVIRLFQPLVTCTATTTTPPTALNETPQEIVRYSQAMFETVLRLYYLRHSYRSLDGWIIHFLVVLGTTTVKSLYNTGPDTDQQAIDVLRSSLALAIKGLEQQSKNVYIAKICALVLRESMRPKDRHWVQMYLYLDAVTMEEQRIHSESTRCAYPVPIVNAAGNLDTKQLGEVMRGVKGLSLKQQSSDDDDDDDDDDDAG